MTSPVVIFNPTAGRGARAWPLYEAELLRRGTTIRATKAAGDARVLARQTIEEGAELVIAAGGDGTLGEVAGALFQAKCAAKLGVLPLGTGNDFARTLGVWGRPTRALDAIFEGQTRQVDVGSIECGGVEHAWINVAGCGIDSLVARRINAWGKRKTMRHVRGLNAYLLAVACELTSFRTFELKMELDGEPIETHAVLCAIANAKSYGGGMLVCPDAELDDGLFDVCIIGEASRGEFLRAFPGVFAGKHTNHPKVMMRRCRSIRIESSEAVPVLADGEIVGTTPFRCEIMPRVLEICVSKERG